jgi:hypothetical protein
MQTYNSIQFNNNNNNNMMMMMRQKYSLDKFVLTLDNLQTLVRRGISRPAKWLFLKKESVQWNNNYDDDDDYNYDNHCTSLYIPMESVLFCGA